MSIPMTDEEIARDYRDWKNGNVIRYDGYTVQPSTDFGTKGTLESHAWVICKGGCNAMPGATWASSQRDAMMLISVLEAVGGDGQKFWHLLRAIQYATGMIK